MDSREYYVYITTNKTKTVLYTGRTDNLMQRITEHWLNRGKPETFAGKYHCYNLLYFEHSKYVLNTIAREKEIKGWVRSKKEKLIREFNPNWDFLNSEIMEWPPSDAFHRGDFV
ncbi:endonuclease [Roseivirga sp. 4D4]|uniref:GIY-YIG nuclease family protein n=1 Tax=Roseivirga sp. 4D4 TaxID=1889784 RepID=UPI000853153C|nr:GIY-YIG nuclease family protein [Roseivirga sp. 4D4]OEK00243.1 endonuclease [Roseivirga sp. 4D4]